RRHTGCSGDWSSDVCSSDLVVALVVLPPERQLPADVGLQLHRRPAPLDGSQVQGAAGTSGEPWTVQEYAGPVDDPRRLIARLCRSEERRVGYCGRSTSQWAT